MDSLGFMILHYHLGKKSRQKYQRQEIAKILIMEKIRNTLLTINKVKQERDKDINKSLKLLKL